MSRKKKRPLPPRTLRMNRDGRLQSAPTWVATQRGRPAERIARSYRKRYGVDWECAITELGLLGVVFEPKWREALARSLEAARRANGQKTEAAKRMERPESNADFASIAGFTAGGAPYGTTWEELARPQGCGAIRSEPDRNTPPTQVDDALPF